MHESFEAPAAIELWAQRRGHGVSYTRLYLGDVCPRDCAGFDFLIIMGGPQSPATTLQECPYFDAKKEMQFIKAAIDQEKIVLGVCLGAQLIGEALGAPFGHSPNKEIGVFELTLTASGKQDPLFSTFPEKFLVGHWHGDMPGLTRDAKVLATSQGCPRQIVQYGPRVYGLQCHFEFTPEAIEGMVRNCGHELEEGKNLPYVQSAALLRQQDYAGMNALLFNLLDYLTTPAVCDLPMDTIDSKKCVPCEGGVAKLTADRISVLLKQLNGWSLQGDQIQKEYQFKDFKQAMVFVNKLAAIAEAEGHHPDFTVHYNVVTVSTWTHSINGLSENDFILASKIDG